jgi:hypothetical protein
MIAALVLWLAASPPLELVNQVFDIPARQWRYIEIPANPPGAVLNCEFQASGSEVRLVLAGRGQLNAWRAGRGPQGTAATPIAWRGSLRAAVREPDVDVAIDNSGPQPARVHLRVMREEPPVRYLSRARKLAVILISFGIFFAIVTFSARKLFKAIRR